MLGKQKVKYIQSLGQKKLRDTEGLFLAEGPKIVAELLSAAKENILQVYVQEDWLTENAATFADIETISVSEDELAKISQLATPNKVLAVAKQFTPHTPVVKNKITLALDTIQDPGNLGTIIRIADWFGIDTLVCSGYSADVYNPKVIQATMGSIARVNIWYAELAPWLAAQDLPIYAAALEGKDVSAIKKIKEGIIVIGNESKGISPEIMDLVNTKITIPRKGHAESLNAAVAAGIILAQVV